MQVSRLTAFAILAICTISGCRTAGVNDLARPEPPPPLKSANAAEILAEHNRNAERIQILEAQPALTITVAEPNKEKSSYSVDGQLTMERPRNFKLKVKHTTSDLADIGSNDKEYWFWVKDKSQKGIYYCNYDESGSSPLAATFQPDWITEAMGLRIIPEEEAAEIDVKTEGSGRLVLTHKPHQAGGESYTRRTILDRDTHRILEHQILSGDSKTLLARAVVPDGYYTLAIPTEPGGENETVLIPKRLLLSWTQEKLDLDVQFSRTVKINVPIRESRRPYLFVEPSLGRSYPRINLAERTPGEAPPTTIRETRPAPPSGSGVRLREPTPLRDGEAARTERSTAAPLALGGVEPRGPSLTDEVVGARYPTALEPDWLKAESPGWQNATTPGFTP